MSPQSSKETIIFLWLTVVTLQDQLSQTNTVLVLYRPSEKVTSERVETGCLLGYDCGSFLGSTLIYCLRWYRGHRLFSCWGQASNFLDTCVLNSSLNFHFLLDLITRFAFSIGLTNSKKT